MKPIPNNQSVKGAVVVTLWQNETDVKFQMDIYSHTQKIKKKQYLLQAGKIRYGGQFPCEILLLPHQ